MDRRSRPNSSGTDVRLDDALVAGADAVDAPNESQRIPGGTHGFDGSQLYTARVDGDHTPYDRLLDFAAQQLDAG